MADRSLRPLRPARSAGPRPPAPPRQGRSRDPRAGLRRLLGRVAEDGSDGHQRAAAQLHGPRLPGDPQPAHAGIPVPGHRGGIRRYRNRRDRIARLERAAPPPPSLPRPGAIVGTGFAVLRWTPLAEYLTVEKVTALLARPRGAWWAPVALIAQLRDPLPPGRAGDADDDRRRHGLRRRRGSIYNFIGVFLGGAATYFWAGGWGGTSCSTSPATG